MSEWRKSTRCGSSACVEVAVGDPVRVRATLGEGGSVAFGPVAWRAFLALVKAGGVDG